MIELYAVPPGEDDAFLAAYRGRSARRPHALPRADAPTRRYRFASVRGPPRDGALLIVELDDEHAWEQATATFEGRQGFLGAERHGDGRRRPLVEPADVRPNGQRAG